MILQYKNALNLLYGDNAGDLLYGFAEELCDKAFNNEISPEIPIILTTAMSPYNRSGGWYSPVSNTIEIVRHYAKGSDHGIVPRSKSDILAALSHEFCHVYQYQVLGGKTGKRGSHRCKSWYKAITRASPFVCGVNIGELCKPLKSVRDGGNVRKVPNEISLSEVELTHFPDSIFYLIKKKDARLDDRIIGKPAIDL